MENEISIASLIISIIILIVVIIIVIIIGYANNSNNSKQLKDNFRGEISCAPHWYSLQWGTSQCCGRQDGATGCTTEVSNKRGCCEGGVCDLCA
jgi:hypothetical protein